MRKTLRRTKERMPEYLYLIDDTLNTRVESCVQDRSGLYHIRFQNNPSEYKYRPSKVIILKHHKTYFSPFFSIKQIESNAPLNYTGVVEEYLSTGTTPIRKCWCLNGRYYTDDKVRLEPSCEPQKSKDAFHYLQKIASLGLKAEDGTELLSGQYNKIAIIEADSLLDVYLRGDVNYNSRIQPVVANPIFPFGSNKSQYKAVKNALCNQLSLIQGPPGTGKTQTILNIVANLIIAGKSVQIVSNNNSAVENVAEKMAKPKYALDFLVAQLGNSDNKTSFVETQTGSYPDISSWHIEQTQLRNLNQEIHDLSAKVGTLYEKQERIAIIDNTLLQLEAEQRHFDQYCTSAIFTEDIKNLSASQILRLIQRIETDNEQNGKLSIWTIIWLFFLRWFGFDKRDQQNVDALKRLYYIKYKQELLHERAEAQKYVDVYKHLSIELETKSLQYLQGVVFERYKDFQERTIYDIAQIRNSAQEFLEDYPVVLSTTFSALSNISPTNKFDYVIMDEASQIDIATGALALYSARNAVIVGDLKQLPNVVTDDVRNTTDELFAQFDLPESFQYGDNSFLKSLTTLFPRVPSTLLREHYRCHPLIIGFCNKKFYGGELIVMTTGNEQDKAMNMLRTIAGNHARGAVNIRQVDAIEQEIIPTISVSKEEIGIIAPYNKQVDAIHYKLEAIHSEEILAATVHKFQGREKDVIILSTVDNSIGDFVDDPNLLNVAISRAKKQFYLVVSGDDSSTGNIHDLIKYIEYYDGSVIESSISSVFDLLYSAYTKERMEYVNSHKRISIYDSENIFYHLLLKIQKQYDLTNIAIACHFPLRMLIPNTSLLNAEEANYVHHLGTHVDFLLYDKASLAPLYAIEVDGCAFHKEGSKQHERDLLKDSIIAKYQIPFRRFRTNESNEEARLIGDMKQYGIIKTL